MTAGPPDITTQVVVVGAGPVGLMLAGELRLGGADVVVLERLPEPASESRASTLHARTMEIFDSRGLLGEVGTAPNDRTGHFGGVPLDLTLPTAFPGQWKVPQARTEEILQAHAASLGADIRRGHTVLEIAAGPDHVDVTAGSGGRRLRVRGEYAVACDGTGSTVRRLLGAEFPGWDAARELLRADVAGIEIPNRRFQRMERGLAIAARRPDGVTRVMVHEFGTPAGTSSADPDYGADLDYGAVADAWKRVTGEDISGGTPLWVNSFGDASRQLTRYRHGRVLFAGDAAHEQMPIGGQALNLGLQDAFNLGWKLAKQVNGGAPAGLLDSYHDERHHVGESVLTNIRAQAILLLGGPEVNPVRAVVGELTRIEPVRRHLAAMIAGLDIRYPAGDGSHSLVGARMPHVLVTTAHGDAASVAALLRAGRGLLVDFTGERPSRLLREAADEAGVDVAYGQPGAIPGAGALLARPDGYVAWAARDGNAGLLEAGLQEALHRWFGGG
jgi:2-polyprenyl-6-methoxyphenol hydroxylase-like FAD-dependent oxidoreductase